MRNAEVSFRIGLHPPLIGLRPFLKIIQTFIGLRLLLETHPDSASRGIWIATVFNREPALDCAATRRRHEPRMVEPTVWPRFFLGSGLLFRVGEEHVRGLLRVLYGSGNVIEVHEP